MASEQTIAHKTSTEMLEFFYFISNIYAIENYIVYILFSQIKNRFYIGFTSNLEERIIRHNQKSKGFTRNTNDWEILYTENFSTKEDAHKRELQIKAWKSRVKIQELISKK